MWWHSRWQSYVVQVIKLYHPCYTHSIVKRKNLFFFFFPTNCLQSAMLTAASTGILWHCHISRNSAHKTELLLPMREPGGSISLTGRKLPEESLSLKPFNLSTSIPMTSHLKKSQSPKLTPPCAVSLGSVVFARKQLQGQDLKARAIHISVSACLSLGHLSNHAGFPSYWGKQVLAMPEGGISCSQRWPWVFP